MTGDTEPGSRESTGSAGAWGGSLVEASVRLPDLRNRIIRLCKAITRRDEVPARVELGTSPDSQIWEALLRVFGPAHLKVRGGRTVLALRDFLAPMSPGNRELWLQSLFDAAGMRYTSRTLEREAAAVAFVTLRQRFRLAYPELVCSAQTLAADAPIWQRRIERHDAATVGRLLMDSGIAASHMIQNREPMTLSDLGARTLGDSKALRGGERLQLACRWLALESGTEDSAEVTLARHHVVSHAGSIEVRFFGPLAYYKRGRWHIFPAELHAEGEAAVLTWQNLQGIEDLRLEGEGPVLGCENESPFFHLMRQGFPGCVLYTQGFPNAAVQRLWQLLGQHCGQREFLHWGDSDLAGLRIAAILHAVHPLRLWRCSHKELEQVRACACDRLRALEPPEAARIADYLEAHPDFPFRQELEFTQRQGWLEQENYLPLPPTS